MASSLYQNKRKAVYLPEELCVEILKRVEVVSLLRFRCVCKSWNSLISSPSFINTHHLSFKLNDPNYKSYFLYVFNNEHLRFSNCNYTTSYAFYNPEAQSPPRAKDLKLVPFQQVLLQIIDVIHGIVCLAPRRDANEYSDAASILWNPTIHKYVKIPTWGSGQPFQSYVGFGFDARKNDFKAVRIIRRFGRASGVEVFSTLEGRLRSLAVDDAGLLSRCYWLTIFRGCFINGSIHWIVYIGDKYSMLVFDCESEEFKTMELPDPQELNLSVGRMLRVYNTYHGMLSLWCTFASGRSHFWQAEAVWVMEEYGVASSWKKLTPQQLSRFVKIEHPSQTKDRSIINGNVFKPSMFFMDARQDPYASTFI